MEVSGELIGAIKSLQELRRLELADSRLVDEGLQRLAKLTHLTELRLEGAQLSSPAKDAFTATLPSCALYVDGQLHEN